MSEKMTDTEAWAEGLLTDKDTGEGMRGALAMLRAATLRFPPPPRCHHALTVGDAGALLLTLHVGEKWHAFTIDEADMDRGPGDILNDIDAMLVRAR